MADGALVEYTCGHSKLVNFQYGISINRHSVKVKGNKDPDTEVESEFIIEFDCIANADGCYRIELYYFKTILGEENGAAIQKRTKLIVPIEGVEIKKGFYKPLRREVERTFPDFCDAEMFYLIIQTRSVNSENNRSVSQFTQAVIQKKIDPGYTVRAINQKIWFQGRQYQVNDYTGYDKTSLSKIPSSECEICYTRKMDSTMKRVGNFVVSTYETGKSRDIKITSIHDGRYGDAEVTVKKMLKEYEDAADKEIQILEKCAGKPNFPLFHKVKEEDEDGYVYIALERCACSLKDLISPTNQNLTQDLKNIDLLSAGSKPSPHLLNIIRGVAEGLDHLHNELKYVHGGLNKETILIRKNTTSNSITPILSDLSGCETLLAVVADSSSTKVNAAELKAKDLEHFAELIFLCISGGVEFKKGQPNMHHVKDTKANDLIRCILYTKTVERLTAKQLVRHPLVWSPKACIEFLIEASNQIEKQILSLPEQDRISHREHLRDKLDNNCCCSENCARGNACCYNDWKSKLHIELHPQIADQVNRRGYPYDGNSASDLVRVIRNLYAHPPSRKDLPTEVKQAPYGFAGYIVGKFPDIVGKFPELGWQVYEFLKKEIRCEVYTLLEGSPLNGDTPSAPFVFH